MNNTQPSIPCYISGKGMHASNTTWSFKTELILALEKTGFGYDTRFRYYQTQFPDMDTAALARMVCDPMEYYDKDFPAWLETHKNEQSEAMLATRFMLELDDIFREQAQAAIYCYDEAGFGSGVNSMRFLTAGKPILGFYNPEQLSRPLNISNILQLEIHYPELFTLIPYHHSSEIIEQSLTWLRNGLNTEVR